jgi:hypothetical protein
VGPSTPTDVPEHPRHISVPIGGGFFVYLPIDPTPLRLAHVPLVNAWGAMQRWVEADPEKRVLFWRASWTALLFALWYEGLVELWGRDTPELKAKLTQLDFVLPERHSHLFGPLDRMRWQLQYLPTNRWFHDLHMRAVVPADVDPRQPELPMDDPQGAPAETGPSLPSVPVGNGSEPLSVISDPGGKAKADDGEYLEELPERPSPLAPKRRRPAEWFFGLADEFLADGINPDGPHCWSQVSDRLKEKHRTGDHNYNVDQVRLAMNWRAYEKAQRDG